MHQDEHLIVYDLRLARCGPDPRRSRHAAPARARARDLRTRPHRARGRRRRRARQQPPRRAPDVALRHRAAARPRHIRRRRTDADFPDPDYLVYVRDDAILPSRFLDDLVATQAHLDVDRVQPTHISGPASGPPIIERHKGVIAREVAAPDAAARAVGARRGRPRWPGGASRPRERGTSRAGACDRRCHRRLFARVARCGCAAPTVRSCATTAPSRRAFRASVS